MMPKIRGEVTALSGSIGGGVHTYDTEYVHLYGSAPCTLKWNWYKSRWLLPVIQVGDLQLNNVFVANDQLGHDIAENIKQGDRLCFFTYGHLMRKHGIIGVKHEKSPSFVMPAGGFESGLFWYAVFSPIVVGIPAVVVGMIVGMLGGKSGTAFGLLAGVKDASAVEFLACL
jgi:hypothetical protein